MSNYVCPDCGNRQGMAGRCKNRRAHAWPAVAPRVEFESASVFDPGEPPELYPARAATAEEMQTVTMRDQRSDGR